MLSTSFPSWWRKGSLLIVVDLGIDESQIGSVLALSAVVGKVDSMKKLDSEWRRELSMAGVDFFHAKEHWNGKSKAYNGASRQTRDRLLNQLILHFHHRFLFAATVMVDEVEFNTITSRRFRSQYGSPYGFAFQQLMMLVNWNLVLIKRFQPVNILIEDGHANAGQVIEMIKRKKTLDPNKGLRVNSYGLGPKRDHPILQAADLVAYGMCQWEVKDRSEIAKRTFTSKYGDRFPKLPWDRSSVDSIRKDITWHQGNLKLGTPGAKRLVELVVW